jgi:hypothetical protein
MGEFPWLSSLIFTPGGTLACFYLSRYMWVSEAPNLRLGKKFEEKSFGLHRGVFLQEKGRGRALSLLESMFQDAALSGPL